VFLQLYRAAVVDGAIIPHTIGYEFHPSFLRNDR
jgi:hypothetical protein